ncbi:MAG: CvpA family protein [Lachnospirales bacterium]
MLDIILILVFLISLLIGKKIGAFKAIFAIISFFASFTIGKILTPIIMPHLLKTSMYDNLFISFKDMLNLEETINNISRNAQTSLLSELPFGSNIIEKLIENNNVSIYEMLGVDQFADYVAGMLAYITLFIGTSIVVFIAVYIIIIIIGFSLDVFTKLPIISTFNGILGGILGIVNTAFILWFIAIIIEIFMMNTYAITFNEMVSKSILGEIFFSNNIFIYWLKNLLTVG